ncbi:AAA family ATPase [Selenomonas sp. AE3005]|uniref:AAA family ATPase n=1 Tax=Selenomonas sp. AE3005 TaxID=1485543 RepID=UPI0025FF87AE|nr:AAA family ATPase [Selenomonas sp. AE3005]
MCGKRVNILRIVYDNVKLYKDNRFEVNFIATDRVSDPEQVYQIYGNVYSQKMVALAGINASGKTSALKLIHWAMTIVLQNDSLNENSIYGRDFVQDGTILTVDFYCDNKFYELRSEICINKVEGTSQQRLYFKDEWIYVKEKSKVHKKNDCLSFEELLYQRSELKEEVKSVIKDDDSIVITVTRDNETELHQLLPFTDINLLMATDNIPTDWLHVFDPNLEALKVYKGDNDSDSYQVKFKGWKKAVTFNNPFMLSNVVSSGTIKGQNLIYHIKKVLKSGGYVIVDELENHLNKELVRMITNIFKDENINKNGACLIFSTHYVELLDFVDRKDNIFITRKEPENPMAIEILNYAKEVKRNDVKKSEVFLSNIIQGTAPRYEYIRALEDSLCEA